MTDWLARRVGSVIDFRLPEDPPDIPAAVIHARISEYYAQLRAHWYGGPARPLYRPVFGSEV